jgi:hypothetical protein
MLPSELEQAFQKHNQADEVRQITEVYEELTSRTEKYHNPFPGEDYGEPGRIRANGLVFRQVLLHRSIQLFEGSVRAAVDENVYSMTLSIRGHFETTASLGYFHQRLLSLKKGNISAETIDRDLTVQLLGVHHGSVPQAPDPINILSLFEHADKSVNTSVIGASTKQYDILKDSYEYLCEFAHPNFHSNSVAIDLDKSIPEFRFRHGQPIRDYEFKLIGYLLLSTPTFVALFDQISDLLPSKD